MERIITSIKGPVKIAYNKFVSNLAKQEDTTYLALCQFTEIKNIFTLYNGKYQINKRE